VNPNAYYNFLKDRKKEYVRNKETTKEAIKKIYHMSGGILGYRTMRGHLDRNNIRLSFLTVHTYMNKELGLKSITRRKKPNYAYGKPHKIFENLLQQDFTAEKPNEKWCVDFTYLYMEKENVRYNCTIVDLYDRSVVASEQGPNITAELAVKTLKKALKSLPKRMRRKIKKNLILHSDQGSQFASKEFIDFCSENGITQSMSKAGCPYDNAVMERYFNSLKNELIYHHSYKTEKELDAAVEYYAYVFYNNLRPNSAIDYQTPYEKRFGKIRSCCYKIA
jgi:putative transposase